MLTRLEVSGFKNLRDVRLDLGPFTCIAGENGVGKSNVLDAIEFLSSMTEMSFGEAAQALQGSHSLKDFRTAVVKGQRRGGAFLSTTHRDGGAGRQRPR